MTLGGCLVAVIRGLLSQMQKGNAANLTFQAQLLQHIETSSVEQREVNAALVRTQESILGRLESLEHTIRGEAA